MNTELKKSAKNDFGKYFFKLMNYHTAKISTQHLLAVEMKITEILLNKHLYLGLSILTRTK